MALAYAYLLTLFTFFNDGHSARILGLFPHTGRSHQMVFEPLLRTLAERGHHVTVASFFPLKYPPANYTDVSFEGIAGVGIETIDLMWYEDPNIFMKVPVLGRILRQISDFQPLAYMALNVCSRAVDWPPLVEALQKTYDIVLVENFNSDCMLGLLHAYKIESPVVALLSSSLLPWSADRISVMDNPSYVPGLSTSFSSPMTLIQRLENTFMNLYLKYWFKYSIQMEEHRIIENRYGKIPGLDQLTLNTSLMLVNTHHSFNGRNILPPGIVEVGGMHLNPARAYIPQHIERFLNESEHGAVLFSFGSLIKTSTMPKYKEEILIRSLSKLKQRVIWKFEDSPEDGVVIGNILKVRWLPQYELLQHKKVIAFIAHGGLLGMTEAISAGKPMVVMPFFGDQPTNGAAAQAAGFARVVSWMELTEECLDTALQSVLGAETRMKARLMSQIWRDRESSPLDTAVYWTERVIRWGHAAPLHSIAREMPFYQIALLDVVAVFLVAFTLILVILFYLLRKILQLFTKESKMKIH